MGLYRVLVQNHVIRIIAFFPFYVFSEKKVALVVRVDLNIAGQSSKGLWCLKVTLVVLTPRSTLKST